MKHARVAAKTAITSARRARLVEHGQRLRHGKYLCRCRPMPVPMDEGEGHGEVDVVELVALCVALGERAGEICRSVAFSGNLGAIDKGGDTDVRSGEYIADVQTHADRRAERLMTCAIRERFADVLVVAEEEAGGSHHTASAIDGNDTFEGIPGYIMDAVRCAEWPRWLGCVKASRVCVYIDPLDGTGEFSRENYGVTTNLIGIAVDGRPVAGIINEPFLGHVKGEDLTAARSRTVWGGPGAGVHGCTADCACEPRTRTACANRVKDDRIIPCLEAIGIPQQEVSWVSASGFNLLQVLLGNRALYLVTRKGTKKWDTCAGTALIEAKGGKVTDVLGREYVYGIHPDGDMNLCGILASLDPELHAASVTHVQRVCAPWPLDVADASIFDST